MVPDRRRAEIELSAGSDPSRRWSIDGSWRWSVGDDADPLLLADAFAPFVPGFLEGYRTHVARLGATWTTPTDPLPLALTSTVVWGSAIDRSRPATATAWLGLAPEHRGSRAWTRVEVRGGYVVDPASVPLPLVVA